MVVFVYSCVLLGWSIVVNTFTFNIKLFDLSNSFILVCSANVKFNTSLSINTSNIRKYYNLSPCHSSNASKEEYFNQMIIGLILGDGTLVRKYEKGNTYFKFAQSLSHIDYIQHNFNIFVLANYCNITKLDVKKFIVKGNIHKYFYFTTKSLQEFKMLHSLFYSQGKNSSYNNRKIINSYWVSILDNG